jgi:hypothetical protein
MTRHPPPDTLLIGLLRTSDEPSDEELRRLRDSIDLSLSDGDDCSNELSALSRERWTEQSRARSFWNRLIFVTRRFLSATVARLGRAFFKVRALPPRPSPM